MASEDRYVMVSQGDCPDEELVSTNGGLSTGALTHVGHQEPPKDEPLEGAPTAKSPEDKEESELPECTLTAKRVSCPPTYENLAPQSISIIGADSSQKSQSTQQVGQRKRRSCDEVARRDRPSFL